MYSKQITRQTNHNRLLPTYSYCSSSYYPRFVATAALPFLSPEAFEPIIIGCLCRPWYRVLGLALLETRPVISLITEPELAPPALPQSNGSLPCLAQKATCTRLHVPHACSSIDLTRPCRYFASYRVQGQTHDNPSLHRRFRPPRHPPASQASDAAIPGLPLIISPLARKPLHSPN